MSTSSSDLLMQAAMQSQLSKEGEGFLPVYNAPSSGLILRASAWNVPLSAAVDLTNLRWDGISWTTQNIGWMQVRSAVFNSGAPFMGMGVHFLTSGAPVLIQQVGTQVQRFDPTIPGFTEQVLFTAASQTVPSMTSFSPNFFLYTNGVDHPQFWNGSTWGAMSLFPFVNASTTYDFPNLVESFNNRACYAGFLNQPCALMISDFGNPNVCSINVTPTAANGGLYFTPSKYGPITSIKAIRISELSNQQLLVVGCQYGVCFLSGTDGTNFTMVPTTNRFGILSQNVYFDIDSTYQVLCSDGIRQFNANSTFQNLIAGALSYPVQPLIKSMAKTNLPLMQQAFVLDNPNELEATWYYSSTADVHNRTALIMNYASIYSGSVMFSKKQFPTEVAGIPTSIFSPSCGVQYKGNYYAGGYNGILQQLYTTNTWNGSGVAWNYVSPMFKPNQLSQEATFRGFWIVMDGQSPTFKASAKAWPGMASDQNMRPRQLRSQVLSPSTGGGTKLGSWVLGVSPFGGSQPILVPYYPQSGGRTVQVNLSGNTNDSDCNLLGIYGMLNIGGTRQ